MFQDISTITFNINDNPSKETDDDIQSTPNSETSSTTTYVSSIPTLETNSETEEGQSTSIPTSVTSSTATSHVPSHTAHNESNGVSVEEMDSNDGLESRYTRITNFNNIYLLEVPLTLNIFSCINCRFDFRLPDGFTPN